MPNSRPPKTLQTDNKKSSLPWLWIILAIIGIVVTFLFLSGRLFLSPTDSASQAKNGGLFGSAATPTPMPFYDMTIPALRQKTYESTLGPLTSVGQNESYSSYLTYFTSEGLKVNGLLTIPTGEEPKNGWPAIVFIHGYIPPTLYQTQGQYADYVDYLARNGFVVFKIDLRGHANSEGEPGGGYYGSDYVVDALNSYDALSQADFVNPERIGLWGHSMAGNIVMRSMAARPEIPAGVIWAGAVYSYVDMQKYGIDDNSYRPPSNNTERQRRRRELFEKHGSPSAQSVFWRQVAPTNYLTDLKGAIQLNHAIDDDVVNIGYSRDLVTLLDKTSVPHELHEYSTGGHNISGSAYNQAMVNTVEFFR
jgi:uncharacterized protein